MISFCRIVELKEFGSSVLKTSSPIDELEFEDVNELDFELEKGTSPREVCKVEVEVIVVVVVGTGMGLGLENPGLAFKLFNGKIGLL